VVRGDVTGAAFKFQPAALATSGGPMWTHTVNASNGAAYLSIDYGSVASSKCVFRDKASVPGSGLSTIRFEAVPDPGYQFTTMYGTNLSPRLGFGDRITVSGPANFTVNFTRMARLHTLTSIKDYSCATFCAGYVAQSTAVGGAQYYYSRPVRAPEGSGSLSSDGATVKLEANPNPGFVFGHWEGDGICWTSPVYITATDPAYEQLRKASCKDLNNKAEPVTTNPIYIQMNNKKSYNDDDEGRYSGGDRTLKAVFSSGPHPVNFTAKASATNQPAGICGGNLTSVKEYVDVSWESSTGVKSSTGTLPDLAGGKIVEVLSDSPSVSSKEVEDCVNGNFSVIFNGNPNRLPCDLGVQLSLPAPWDKVVPNEYTFSSWSSWDAEPGILQNDCHGVLAYCKDLGCDSSTWTRKQFFVWLPPPSVACQKARVVGEFDQNISRDGKAKTIRVEVKGVSYDYTCSECPGTACPQ
jgi:hypothetical protein